MSGRPKRNTKQPERLTYDTLGGIDEEQEKERGEDDFGSDVEEIDTDEEIRANPYDDPAVNDYQEDDWVVKDEEMDDVSEQVDVDSESILEDSSSQITDEEDSEFDSDELFDDDEEGEYDDDEEEFFDTKAGDECDVEQEKPLE